MVYCKSIGLAKLFRKPIQWQLPAFPKVHVRKTCHTLSNFLNPDLRIPPQVQAGRRCCRWEAPAHRPFFYRHWKRANFQSRGGRLGSDLHIWVVVPSPGSKATAQRRQAATRCWPPCFFAAIQPPAPTTLWPLNTLVWPLHPGQTNTSFSSSSQQVK